MAAARLVAVAYIAVSLLEAFFAFAGPASLDQITIGDSVFFLLIVAHFAWGSVLLFPRRRFKRSRVARFMLLPEALLVVSLVVFLFSYFYALNANMSYVQRFMETGGSLRLALDTRTERLLALARFFPFVLLGAAVWIHTRLRYRAVTGSAMPHPFGRFVSRWALPFVFVAVFMTTVSIPSFLSLRGLGFLGWVSLVPLFLVLRRSTFGRGVFYGIAFGVLTTLLQNYWLATFNLVSLQFTVVLWLIFYAIFIPILVLLVRFARVFAVLVFPLAWTAFEYLTSIGFLGYPWGMVAHSQYLTLPLIQIASITGVWGITFLVVFANAALERLLVALGERRPVPVWSVGAAGLLIAATLIGGGITLALDGTRADEEGRTSTVALIQQNSDPRKHTYERTFGTLRRLTDEALEEDPDLVVWSETAFVPNIRRWSQEDPDRYRLASLVREFLAYQESIGTWLVTGNDDYTRTETPEGETIRRDYNAAVLFSDEGERIETYHKIKLVPFTEYFPYREQLPWVYELLQDFDVTFWVPGNERTVFEFPGFRFSTPICFEDIFPNQVRRFVLEGAEVIVNLSNDYWSLDPVEAQQHFAGSLFRSVEHRVPLLRSTASGITGHVDRFGRIRATLPPYVADYLVTEVERPPAGRTFYTRHGDWFPYAALLGLVVLLIVSLVRRRGGTRD